MLINVTLILCIYTSAGCSRQVKEIDNPNNSDVDASMTVYDLEIEGERPGNGSPYVEITGRFRRRGFVEWKPGLTLGYIETKVGYKRFSQSVYIIREDSVIYKAELVKRTRSKRTRSGAERVLESSEAPELQPNDVVIAERLIGF